MPEFTDEQILHIFVEIANGRGRHGDFLKSFAGAIQFADPFNFVLIRDAAIEIIVKYTLEEYLDNFEANR